MEQDKQLCRAQIAEARRQLLQEQQAARAAVEAAQAAAFKAEASATVANEQAQVARDQLQQLQRDNAAAVARAKSVQEQKRSLHVDVSNASRKATRATEGASATFERLSLSEQHALSVI